MVIPNLTQISTINLNLQPPQSLCQLYMTSYQNKFPLTGGNFFDFLKLICRVSLKIKTMWANFFNFPTYFVECLYKLKFCDQGRTQGCRGVFDPYTHCNFLLSYSTFLDFFLFIKLLKSGFCKLGQIRNHVRHCLWLMMIVYQNFALNFLFGVFWHQMKHIKNTTLNLHKKTQPNT